MSWKDVAIERGEGCRRAIRQESETELPSGLAVEQECFDRTMRPQDAAGAMRAWLSGKTYEWKGK
jgi:hypothetical protein